MKIVSLKKDHALTHDENRLKICLVCEQKKKNVCEINETLNKLINKYFEYNPSDSCLPKALCGTCKLKLYSNETNPKAYPISIPNFASYYDYVARSTRSKVNSICECKICLLARVNGKKKSATKSKTKKVQNKCGKCLSDIARGKTHNCTSQNLLQNISNSLNEKNKDHVAAALLQEKFNNCESQNKESVSLSRIKGNGMVVSIGNSSNSNEQIQITADDLSKISTENGLSLRKTLNIAHSLRVATKKRNLFEPNVRKKLQEFNHELDDYFEITQCKFIGVKKNEIYESDEYVVYCKSVEDLIEHVKNVRDVHDVHYKIGADSGGDFLKIVLQIQDTNVILKGSTIHHVRTKYEDGVSAKKFKDSGVNKLLLIGLTEFSYESHHNVSILWELLQLADMFEKYNSISIAVDLKLANILSGLMSHSSSYPCTYCISQKDNLDTAAELRTIGECIDNNALYEKNGAKKKDCQKFKCCLNAPIISSRREKKLIELIPPPELHLLIGVINKLYDEMLKVFKDVCILWTKRCNVKREILYGSEGFSGNDCNKLIQKVDILREICTSSSNFSCMKYVVCLEKFKGVVDSCFSIELKPDYSQRITAFKQSYLDLNISVTPKVHVVFFHIEDFCKISGIGLGFYAEQAVESTHADFKKIWSKYKHKKTNDNYAANLLKAVREYNSKHV